MKNLFYIMGKSSSGKDTIYKRINEKIKTNNYVSYTTRPRRDGEINKIDYNFITIDDLKKLEKEGKVIESRKYNVINKFGKKDIWFYATINDNQWLNDGIFLTIGTLESYQSFLKYLKDNNNFKLNIFPIYIVIDEKTRLERALNREKTQVNPNYEEMKRRLEADNKDYSEIKLKEAFISDAQTFENYDIEKCTNKILQYINKYNHN